MEGDLAAFSQYANEFFAAYRASFTNYGTTIDQLRGLHETFRARQADAREHFIELHLSMARAVTADEWKALVKEERALLKNIDQSVSGEL
jgi:hypothetical protein